MVLQVASRSQSLATLKPKVSNVPPPGAQAVKITLVLKGLMSLQKGLEGHFHW